MKERSSDLFSGTKPRAEVMDRLGDDIIILENPYSREYPYFPFKSNTSILIITIEGPMECVVDLTHHKTKLPGILIIPPSQIVGKISFGQGYKGFCMVMSMNFLKKLPQANKVPLVTEVRQSAFYPMNEQTALSVIGYIRMIQATMRDTTRYRMEILSHLTAAYYCALGSFIHDHAMQGGTRSRYDRISEEFFALVRENCCKRRDMDFYADKLRLTAKHVSLAVKSVTGKSAMVWIERYTVLNAKELLACTDLSINEISDKLSFSSQSDFGKYFKKFTGLSPRAFRASLKEEV